MVIQYMKKMALPTIVMAWATAYFVECQGYGLKSRRLVSIVFFIMLALYVINGITDFLEERRAYNAQETAREKAPVIDWAAIRQGPAMRTISLFVILGVYVLVLEPLGFILTTFACSLGILLVMDERKPARLILIPIILVIALYVSFKIGLRIPLPVGILGL